MPKSPCSIGSVRYPSPRGSPTDSREEPANLRGFPEGDLLLYDAGCGIVRIHGATSHCETGFGGGTSDVFVVSNDLAYAVEADRALVYNGSDGSAWTQLGAPLTSSTGAVVSAWRVWGGGQVGGQVVAVTSTAGEVFLSDGGGAWVRELGLPEDTYRTTWGFGSENVWIGGRGGALFSYDGSAWRERGQLKDACGSGIQGMWGSDGVLYIYTEHELALWSGTRLVTVKVFPRSTTIRGVWGTSLSQVYLVAADDLKQSTACGAAEVFSVAGVVSVL